MQAISRPRFIWEGSGALSARTVCLLLIRIIIVSRERSQHDHNERFKKIRKFNERGLHYNLVADEVDRIRNSKLDPFDNEYMPCIIVALISFDMGRMAMRKIFLIT